MNVLQAESVLANQLGKGHCGRAGGYDARAGREHHECYRNGYRRSATGDGDGSLVGSGRHPRRIYGEGQSGRSGSGRRSHGQPGGIGRSGETGGGGAGQLNGLRRRSSAHYLGERNRGRRGGDATGATDRQADRHRNRRSRSGDHDRTLVGPDRKPGCIHTQRQSGGRVSGRRSHRQPSGIGDGDGETGRRGAAQLNGLAGCGPA